MSILSRLWMRLNERTEPGAGDDELAPLPVLRMRRLTQLAVLIGTAFLISLLSFYRESSVVMMALMVAGSVLPLASWCIGRTRRPEAGGLALLVGSTFILGTVIWVSNGLHDEGMLVFPVLLLMAELLITAAQFLLLTAAMLLYVLALAVATYYGWRVDTPMTPTWDAWQTITIALVAAAVASSLVLNDLRLALARLATLMEITRASEQQALHLSAHDGLTGLPNRTHGRLQIEQLMAQARRARTSVAVAFVDLDNFKLINDNLGHGAGDEFIRQTSARLKGALRGGDVVARFGGDEFILGIGKLDAAADALSVMEKVLEQLKGSIQAQGHELTVTCSIGVAVFPSDGDDYETLVRKADLAMYDAKAAGRNSIRFFDATMNDSARESLWLIHELRGAIARGELLLHFQPIVDLRSGRVLHAEALLRWLHPVRGSIPPAEFIPLAESSGLIVEIGEWVIGEACRSAVAWHRDGLPGVGVAINLSPVQFRSGEIVAVVQQELATHGLDARLFELEITESLLVLSNERFQRSMAALKAMGVRVAVDDFGTGYSNLAYLQEFKVDVLKIDRSFVRRLGEDEQKSSIVRAIITMAHSLGLHTVAEGIESPQQLAMLQSLGCNAGQGFLLARPAPWTDFVGKVKAGIEVAMQGAALPPDARSLQESSESSSPRA